MSRTVDHIVATRHLAVERRAAGQPIWDRMFNVSDVFRNQSMTFEDRRDTIAARLRASVWCHDSETVQGLADELGDVQDAAEFDAVWDALYDEADRDRVWIVTT